MSVRGAIQVPTGGERRRRPLLHRVGERAGVGALIAALGFCCATALLGPAIASGAGGAAAGVAVGLLMGSAWFLLPLVAGSGAGVWLVTRRRRPRT